MGKIEFMHEVLDLVMQVNGGAVVRNGAGHPTAFYDYSGHVNQIYVHIYPDGWIKDGKDEGDRIRFDLDKPEDSSGNIKAMDRLRAYATGSIQRDAGGIKVVLDEGAYMPERAHKTDAGLDLRSPMDFTLEAGKSLKIDSGAHIAIPVGHVGFLKAKSGLNVKYGITSTGVIDAGYTGSIAVKLYNHGNEDVEFKRGDKITQLVILPIATPDLVQVDSLEDTERGDAGFGSTGR